MRGRGTQDQPPKRDVATRWSALSLEKKMTLIGAPLLVAVVTGLVITPLSSLLTDRKVTRLEVVDLIVKDAVHAFGDPYEPPSIEILIRNTGDLVSVISGLQVEILEYGHLRICEAGGGLDVSATYDLTLPAGAESVGQQLTADVSQEIQVGEADRFAFALTVPHEDFAEGAHLYRLALDLEHDAEETTLDVGMALISAPVPVDEWYVDEESAQLGGSVGDCYAENIRIWDEFSRLEGERSTGMTSPIPH